MVCDMDKLELWRPMLFLEEILSVSAETQRLSLWASSPIPINGYQNYTSYASLKKKQTYLCTIFIWFHCYWYFLLQDIYFIKPLERYCCHQQWVQDMVSWARLSLLRDPWHQSSVPVWFGSLAVSHISPQITCETQSFPLQPWLPHLLAPHISACYVWQPLPSCLVV